MGKTTKVRVGMSTPETGLSQDRATSKKALEDTSLYQLLPWPDFIERPAWHRGNKGMRGGTQTPALEALPVH